MALDLASQEEADMSKFFDFHKAEEEELSLWPLEDEPLLWFSEPPPPDIWVKDPERFSLLWRQREDGADVPVHITGALLPTNLFGRTAAEVFKDFPNDFCDSPSPFSSPTLSPVSSEFSTSSTCGDDVDPSIDEMSQQLLDRIHFESPPQSPSVPEPLPLHVGTPPPLSPPVASSATPSLSLPETYSSSSSTMSVGTLSHAPSTYSPSPSPKPPYTASPSSSPPPGLRRSPRSSHAHPVKISAEPDNLVYPTHTFVPVNQIVLEELPVDATRRRKNAKRSKSYHDDNLDEDEEYEVFVDVMDTRPRKRTTRGAPKRHPCPVPGCSESFTRLNDVLRHVKNAGIHKGTPQQAEALAASSTLCKYCGEELSRADAARRHEAKGSCGKRTIRKKSTYSLLPA